MSRVFEGQLSAAGLKFAVIVSRFNSFITERLLAGAMDALTRTGASPDLIDVIKVPGSWEVPMVAGELARQHRYDALICLSAVIRGETPHFDYVATEAAKGVAHVAAETVCRWPSACSPPTRWSRPSTAREPRAATRASMPP